MYYYICLLSAPRAVLSYSITELQLNCDFLQTDSFSFILDFRQLNIVCFISSHTHTHPHVLPQQYLFCYAIMRQREALLQPRNLYDATTCNLGLLLI